jgi:uncharacterized RDD family membrane protein YckC
MEHTDVVGRRIGAGIIDIGIIIVIVLLVGGIIGNDTAADPPDSARFGTLDRLAILVLAFGYYAVCEGVWAQTIGKKVLGIRVVNVDGSKPGTGPVLIRTILRIVDSFPGFYLVGLISIFATGPRRQRVGDMAAKTRVVAVDETIDEPPAPPPPPSDEDVLSQIMR